MIRLSEAAPAQYWQEGNLPFREARVDVASPIRRVSLRYASLFDRSNDLVILRISCIDTNATEVEPIAGRIFSGGQGSSEIKGRCSDKESDYDYSTNLQPR